MFLDAVFAEAMRTAKIGRVVEYLPAKWARQHFEQFLILGQIELKALNFADGEKLQHAEWLEV